MKIIVCLDDNGGMLFNKRRQSKDSDLRKRVLEITNGARLIMNSYSKNQFEEYGANITVDDNLLENAKTGDYCFIENLSVKDYEPRIEEIVVYKWNRIYPADFKFDILLENKWKLKNTYEFKGNSHETITEEVYTR